ncbi:protein of unknown function [Pararobbsia alpina]
MQARARCVVSGFYNRLVTYYTCEFSNVKHAYFPIIGMWVNDARRTMLVLWRDQHD